LALLDRTILHIGSMKAFQMATTGVDGSGVPRGTFKVKAGLAEMLKGGVIMDVVTPEQARIAEDAAACTVMALERVPAHIRRDGGVARMSDPSLIRVAATTYHERQELLAEVSTGLGKAMPGLEIPTIPEGRAARLPGLVAHLTSERRPCR
jgi:pyridoxal biosynthesis lyase PdxS